MAHKEPLAATRAHALQEQFAVTPLSRDEQSTCTSMLQNVEDARLLLMPTHHIHPDTGDLMGFRFTCPPHAPGTALPVIRQMFHGHTLVECQADENAIHRFMLNLEENRAKMLQFMQQVEAHCTPATLDCIPDNANAAQSTGRGVVAVQGRRSVDSGSWTPELPDRIGIYHAYVRGFNRDARVHKMFFCCSGGLSKASDEFCNLVIDVGKHWTAHEVSESEEAWWLRKGCQRARCRLLYDLAQWFGLEVKSIQDTQAHEAGVYQAVATTDTVEHDLGKMADQVCLHNGCTDTTSRGVNGILCAMHPAEGMWLFRGTARGSCFGSMFGDHATAGVLPTAAPRVSRPNGGSITVQDSKAIVRLRSRPAHREPYMCFDEAYLRTLEKMQWNRDNGYVELVPILVGMP